MRKGKGARASIATADGRRFAAHRFGRVDVAVAPPHPHHAAVLRIAVCLAITAAPSLAQDPAPQVRPPVLVDMVIATVNDSPIMHSELLTLAAGKIRTLEASGRPVRPEDRRALYEEELRDSIQRHTWAQAAKTFGYVPPEQVEAWFQRELERDEQNQVRDLGSYQAFSRELQNQGRTWPTYVREQRVDKMAEFARSFSVTMRMQRQSNLYVTPRMLRETYERFKARYVHEAEAKVAIVSFRGPDAATNAAKAAAAWRAEDLTARALAQRFADATALDTMLASALVPELAAFALQGPVNRVSDPIAGPADVKVAKIVLFAPKRDGRFEDREVQDDLRGLCENRVRAEFTLQALQRAEERTEVWMPSPDIRAKLLR